MDEAAADLVDDDSERSEFLALEKRWTGALRDGDFDAVRQDLAPDFTITTAGWFDAPIGREEWLAAVGAHGLKMFAYDDLSVRRYDACAVVQCRCRQAGVRAAGEGWEMTFRYTDVWIRAPRGWQLVVRHASARPPKTT